MKKTIRCKTLCWRWETNIADNFWKTNSRASVLALISAFILAIGFGLIWYVNESIEEATLAVLFALDLYMLMYWAGIGACIFGGIMLFICFLASMLCVDGDEYEEVEVGFFGMPLFPTPKLDKQEPVDATPNKDSQR